jgi:hypothetical protein
MIIAACVVGFSVLVVLVYVGLDWCCAHVPDDMLDVL